MIVKTHTTKRYILSDEDAGALRRAAKLLDELYTVSEERGNWERDFLRARDNIDYLLDSLSVGGYWEEDTEIEEDP